jgi:hypothetical protein
MKWCRAHLVLERREYKLDFMPIGALWPEPWSPSEEDQSNNNTRDRDPG